MTRGGTHTYTPDKAGYADTIRFSLAMCTRGPVAMAPKGTAVYMDLMESRLMPKSWSKVKRAALEGELTARTPDPVNIAMMFCDALSGIAYYDDCQVHLRWVEARWVSDPEEEGVVCEVMKAEGETR